MTLFVHAWFRSSSTWFWAKLRRESAFCAYYEPLNEELPKWSPERLRHGPTRAFAGDKHPDIDRHYFHEYLSLIEAGELHFDQALPYGRYYLDSDSTDELLKNYLTRLISAAQSQGQRPALCFCRSQMRSLWMRHNFGGLHICQIRNPWDQWRSFGRHAYFKNTTLLLAFALDRNFPGCFDYVPNFSGMRTAWQQGKNFQYRDIDCLAVFCAIWLASSAQALSASDLVIDVDRLAADPRTCKETEAALARHGVHLNLSDCRLSKDQDHHIDEQAVHAMLQMTLAHIRSQSRWCLLPRSLASVEQKLDCVATKSRELIGSIL